MTIERLIAEFPNDAELEIAWQKERAKAVSNYKEYESGYRTGFFGWKDGEYKLRPDIGAAKVAAMYPNGAADFLKEYKLNGVEARDLVNKVDAIIDWINAEESSKGAV